MGEQEDERRKVQGKQEDKDKGVREESGLSRMIMSIGVGGESEEERSPEEDFGALKAFKSKDKNKDNTRDGRRLRI